MPARAILVAPVLRLACAVLLCGTAACRQVAGYGAPRGDLGRPDVGAVGGVGLPCYANDTCNAGLRCARGRCFAPDLALADTPRDVAALDLAPDHGPPDLGLSFQPQSCDAAPAPAVTVGSVTTLAGSTPGAGDGPASSAHFRAPTGLAWRAPRMLLIADRDNHRIRELACGALRTFAGSGIAGYQNGPRQSARFSGPSALAVTAGGTVFVADTGNHRVRRIDAQGQVSTLAGSGVSGNGDGDALNATFVTPRGLAWDEATATLYVADYGGRRLRAIKGGSVTTVAGSLEGPLGLAWRDATTLVISEADAHRITQLDLVGKTTTVLAGDGTAGLADGPAGAARFVQPAGLAVTKGDRIWIADAGNRALRELRGGLVGTIAGGPAFAGNADGPLTDARFLSPYGLVVAVGSGSVILADSSGHRLRLVTALP